jgi:CHAT domain-containing protein
VTRKELSAKLNSLRQAIAQIDPLENYREIAGELYRLLILPGVPFIRGKEIIIVPHDVLHDLPFQALYSPDGKYLIEDYALHYL